MDPEISKLSHEAVFQTYKQLKTVLPKDLIKLKVLKSQRYPIIKPSIINEIQKEQNKLNKSRTKNYKKINIFYENCPNIQKRQKLQNISKITKNNNFIKTNNDNENMNMITYKNFREKNMKMLGLNCDTKLKRKNGLYNSFSVNDISMKKNIYLPRIIDRMKYSIPRNLRNNQGLILLGNNVNKIIDKNKNLGFLKKKNQMPTDLYFYKYYKYNLLNPNNYYIKDNDNHCNNTNKDIHNTNINDNADNNNA